LLSLFSDSVCQESLRPCLHRGTTARKCNLNVSSIQINHSNPKKRKELTFKQSLYFVLFLFVDALRTNEILGRFTEFAQWSFVANVKREEQAHTFERAKFASEMQRRFAHLLKESQ
jgi:hypothetical protein